MDNESIFRDLFLLIFFGGSLIRAYYAHKHQVRKREGSAWKRLKEAVHMEGKICASLLVLQGIFLSLAMVLYVFFFPLISWTVLPLPDWFRWIGVALGVISLPLLFWVQNTLGRHWTVSLGVLEEHRLVDTGPYRWVRHPMYTVHIVYFLSWVLVSANLLLLVNYVLTLVLIFRRIPREEEMLLEEFGDEYRTYMRRTGRLLPRLDSLASQD